MENNNKELNMMELNLNDMEQANGGFLGFLLPIAKKVGTTVVHWFKDAPETSLTPSEEAAARIRRQEAEIKEAMKARRESLGLN